MGATLGGPLQKDRTFYFASFERNHVADSRLVTIDPTAASLLTSLGFLVETGNVPLAVTNSAFLIKADHQWSPNHSFVVRSNFADINREGIDDYGGTVARSRGTVQLRTDWALAASETDVFNANWVNEFRTQFAHENQTFGRSIRPAAASAWARTRAARRSKSPAWPASAVSGSRRSLGATIAFSSSTPSATWPGITR
jgi:hypothetical protein